MPTAHPTIVAVLLEDDAEDEALGAAEADPAAVADGMVDWVVLAPISPSAYKPWKSTAWSEKVVLEQQFPSYAQHQLPPTCPLQAMTLTAVVFPAASY